MKSNQTDHNDIHHTDGNQFKSQGHRFDLSKSNSNINNDKDYWQGIADRLMVVGVYVFIVLFVFLILYINHII